MNHIDELAMEVARRLLDSGNGTIAVPDRCLALLDLAELTRVMLHRDRVWGTRRRPARALGAPLVDTRPGSDPPATLQ